MGMDIAVIGMAGRFPKARDVDALWQNLIAGVETISRFSQEELAAAGVSPAVIQDPRFVPAKGVLDDIDRFDAAFFGVYPREARAMDPQHRILLECAWHALENAGYSPRAYPGAIGVYAGSKPNAGYHIHHLMANPDYMAQEDALQTLLANGADYLATRISHKLGLRGPAVSMQSACATSLMAVHLAAVGLLAGDCDMALAGGISIQYPINKGYFYQEGLMLSPDGRCRVFDAEAAGTVQGDGVGLVVLKRLADAERDRDNILAVIKGSAINNDGGGDSFTAPSAEGQARVIRRAHQVAGVSPETITYVEAHGTGTQLGDPTEIDGLTRAFDTDKRGFCRIGSLKTNTGHLFAAAGVASFIKAVLCLEHRLIPPSLSCQTVNPRLHLESTPFRVNRELTPWAAGPTPRRAGVSSFGFGGTNSHAVLEEAPPARPTGPDRGHQLLVLSARTPDALDKASANLAEHLRRHPAVDLADVAWTLQIGRAPMAHRRALVCRDTAEAAQGLLGADPHHLVGDRAEARSVAFMFTGQGAQHPNMERALYDSEPSFRADVDRCCDRLLPELGFDLRTLLFPLPGGEEGSARLLGETAYTQPALFVMEYALARLWMSWGVKPAAMIGHSLGEYVAACLAGVFSLEDGLALVAARGRLMQSMHGGAMLAVSLSEAELAPLLGPELSLAGINGPSMCVVSGAREAVEALEKQLDGRGVFSKRLHVSCAFHSAAMDPILDAFVARVREVRLGAPTLPFVSNLTGTWIRDEEATDPAYWGQHLRAAVRFADGVRTLLEDPSRVLLEVGPGQTLTTLAQSVDPRRMILASLRPVPMGAAQGSGAAKREGGDAGGRRAQESEASLLTAVLGRLWAAGIEVDWAAYHAGRPRRRVPLPVYPFDHRQSYWIEARTSTAAPAMSAMPATPATPASIDEAPIEVTPADDAAPRYRSDVEARVAKVIETVLGVVAGPDDNLWEFGNNSISSSEIAARLGKIFPVRVPVKSIFQHPTIARLASLIEREQLAAAAATAPDARPVAQA